MVTKTKGKRTDNANVPEYVNSLLHILRDNASVRRHVTLLFVSFLRDAKKIPSKGKAYCECSDTKLCVSVMGLKFEYRYSDELFVSALIQGINSFTEHCNTTIITYLDTVNPDWYKADLQDRDKKLNK